MSQLQATRVDLGLKSVHVLVTGASGGIGLETTKLFCALGANVTAHYNSQYAPLEALSRTHTLQIVQSDLSSEPSVIDLFNKLSKGPYGPVQVVVVNHATADVEDAPIADMSLSRWNRIISTNLTSAFLVCREYLRHLRTASEHAKDKAAIVLVGSTAGKYGEAGHADYAVTKSGMMYGLTMTLKNEIVKIAPKGRVNTVAPGWVYTPMAEISLSNADVRYSALATMPLKKIAVPFDIATQIVVQSSSTISGHVTGQVLMVEGGMEGRLLNKPEDI